MIGERYSLEVGDGIAIIHGTLTIAEAFDYLSYFDKQGFKQLIPGDQNSVMHFYRPDDGTSEPMSIDDRTYWESCYQEIVLENEKSAIQIQKVRFENEILKIKIKELETLIKKLVSAECTIDEKPEELPF